MWNFHKRQEQKELLKEQEIRICAFKEQLKEEPLEKGDYLAMVLGAFMALWPALLAVLGIIIAVSLFFSKTGGQVNEVFGNGIPPCRCG